MGGDRRWPLAQALAVAESLRDLLAPACERIEIAGSVRRRRPDVGDIELLCCPKPTDDFAMDALDALVKVALSEDVLGYRPNIKGSIIGDYHLDARGKLGACDSRLKLSWHASSVALL